MAGANGGSANLESGEPELIGTDAAASPTFDIRMPDRQTAPVVFSSPHSGRQYPPEFVSSSRLDAMALRRSEDSFVDEIFAAAPEFGTPLLRALFPRAYVDANREAYELDPAMFDSPLPAYVRTHSPRVAAGLGTVPRVVANGEAIYDTKISFDDVRTRIEAQYRPYHHALNGLLDGTHARFGGVLLVDCHSMPSITSLGGNGGSRGQRSKALKNIDIVLGDCHGASCSPGIVDLAEQALKKMEYRVVRNRPYAGGYITRRHGQPEEGRHALQIEINRALYMDEQRIQRGPGLPNLIRRMNRLIKILSEIDLAMLQPFETKEPAEWQPKAAE